MSPRQKLERLRLAIATATLRHEWATAEAERNGATPALTRFIKESHRECRDLAAKLEKLTRSTTSM
jgi:hypothetical protein